MDIIYIIFYKKARFSPKNAFFLRKVGKIDEFCEFLAVLTTTL